MLERLAPLLTDAVKCIRHSLADEAVEIEVSARQKPSLFPFDQLRHLVRYPTWYGIIPAADP